MATSTTQSDIANASAPMTARTRSRHRAIRRLAQIAFALFLSGCGRAPATYQLRRQGLDPVLFPPTKLKQTATASDIQVRLKNSRAHSQPGQPCDIDGTVVSLHWLGTTAVVSLRTQSFFAATADQSPSQTDRGLYVDPLVAMEKFHSDLLDRQAKGCLSSAENTHLRRAIVENLPLPPAIAYFFQLGSYDVTGYFDLTPDFRLITTSPLYQLGADPTPGNLIGYETAHYVFVPAPQPDAQLNSNSRGFTRKATANAASAANASASATASAPSPDTNPNDTASPASLDTNTDPARIRLALSRATEVLHGDPAIEKTTLRNDLHFPKSPAYFRLLFMADDNSATVRVTRAILLSAPDQARLAQAVTTRPISTEVSAPVEAPVETHVSAENFCATITVPDVTCIIFPKNFGVSPELRVRANNQDYYIRVGGFLQEVLDWRPGDHVLKTLKVRRPFHNRLVRIKFDPTTDDILKLVLLPGDQITW